MKMKAVMLGACFLIVSVWCGGVCVVVCLSLPLFYFLLARRDCNLLLCVCTGLHVL